MRLPSAQQRDFADTISSLLDRRDPLAPMRRAVGPRALDRELWAELTGIGLLEPVAAGDVLTGCLVAEALGRKAAPLPYLSAVIGAALLAGAGGTAAGLTTYGLLDQDGQWSTTAAYAAGRVSGTLPYVPDADVADTVVVLVDDEAGGRALAAVALTHADVTSLECLDGTAPMARVVLEGAPAELLPTVPDLEPLRHLASALHSAALVGSMSWLLATSVEYAGQRVQFGTPIAARQAVKHRCASMLIATESSRSMVLELADALERGAADTALVAATTMAWVTDAAEEVAGGALQLHGGIGFTWEHDLHHYFKRCTAGSLLFGSAASHRAQVATLLAAP